MSWTGTFKENLKLCYGINKDTIHGTMILHDRETLELLAFMDGKAVTALRTGAVGGLSMKYLAKESADRVGIVGTGVQGWSHLEASIAVRDIKKVFLHNRSLEKLQTFKERIHDEYPGISVEGVDVDTLVESSDIIVTTTTSTSPVLPDLETEAWEGKHIVAVGSYKPAMLELPEKLLQSTKPIFVDTTTALTESGDMIKAKELQGDEARFYTLEDMIQGKQGQVPYTLFKSVGMALFDLVTAKFIYEKSVCNQQ
ncbi:ornithine cyclodeaminase family protein [Pseudalkalibacillus salsuginis]|uniref:ornithine cyclodeaminase family protein n=1 Tax=Pseudalkalibacillus salsuginis TaxID=2910972 RepID=UPI001F2F30F3|nr:ornithine cyclodeaminase family protein [Pseudalkalibacillus salsuginis]MCF6411749.1 ornithine cyclodeaminase family protein [Pseudalkalibacillus salsuginis]